MRCVVVRCAIIIVRRVIGCVLVALCRCGCWSVIVNPLDLDDLSFVPSIFNDDTRA